MEAGIDRIQEFVRQRAEGEARSYSITHSGHHIIGAPLPDEQTGVIMCGEAWLGLLRFSRIDHHSKYEQFGSILTGLFLFLELGRRRLP